MKPKHFLLPFMLIIEACGSHSNKPVQLRLKYKQDEEQTFIVSTKADCGTYYINSQTDVTFTADTITNSGANMILAAKINQVTLDMKLPNMLPFSDDDMFNNSQNEIHYDSKKNYADMSEMERKIDKAYSEVINGFNYIAFDDEGKVTRPFTINLHTVSHPFEPALLQVTFPDKEIKPGDTWDNTVEITSPISLQAGGMGNKLPCHLVYTVKDITDDAVTVDTHLELGTKLDGDGEYKINKHNGHTISGYIKLPAPGCNGVQISAFAK